MPDRFGRPIVSGDRAVGRVREAVINWPMTTGPGRDYLCGMHLRLGLVTPGPSS